MTDALLGCRRNSTHRTLTHPQLSLARAKHNTHNAHTHTSGRDSLPIQTMFLISPAITNNSIEHPNTPHSHANAMLLWLV